MIGRTMAQAKRDYEIGYLTEWRITRSTVEPVWMLILGSGNSVGPLVDARTKHSRVFKTLDGLVSTLEQIGFEINELRQ